MVRKADIRASLGWLAAVPLSVVLALSVVLFCDLSSADARRLSHAYSHRAPRGATSVVRLFPLEIANAQYSPIGWVDIAGWADDDHLAAFQTFLASCVAVVAKTTTQPSDPKALGTSLRQPCEAARAATKAARITTASTARAFFEEQFRPLQISKIGDEAGFATGYYEPVVDGSLTRTEIYNVPVYRRPSNLFVRGYNQNSASLPNKGQVFRKIGRRTLVPYYDRGEIEDGALAGRGLEICWLKSQTDLLFIQIQGSARIRFEDGTVMRINYDAHNGYPYTAVGRVLIERNIVPREQMSMQRIRQWMEDNPDGAGELRRQNRSYVFFRTVSLSAAEEAVGAQGVHLTAGRSIAVDKSLHVYGTLFFIGGELPLESEQSKTPFHRLMVAQDTGSAIVGPARADIYFGAGPEAGRVSGRLRHAMQFVILVPRSLDPLQRGSTMPLPESRPSDKIARLFPPQSVPLDGSPRGVPSETNKGSAGVQSKPEISAEAAARIEAAKDPGTHPRTDTRPRAVPTPAARPANADHHDRPRREVGRHRRHRLNR